MIKQLIILFVLFFIPSNLFTDLTSREITDIFEYSNNIKQGFIPEELSNIESFLVNQGAEQLLFARPKLNKLYEGIWSPEDRKNNIAWHSQVFELFRTHDITNYNGNSTRGRNFVLTSQNLFPSYIVKISRHDLSQVQSKPFYHQNISRILYNKLIYKLIDKHQLKHIHSVKKCLVHVPNQPTKLSDENYALVVEKITSIYKFHERIKIFPALLKQALQENRKALELIAEILFLIKKVGLWDIDPRNVFFVENYKVAFIDTERWWYKESSQNFFHQNAEEFEKLCSHGIELLSKLLYGVPDVVETEEDKILQEKAILLENKLMLFQGDEDLVEELRSLLLDNQLLSNKTRINLQI